MPDDPKSSGKFDPKSLVPTKQVFSLANEFKAFAFKGNVIDLAVGVIIGGAFGGVIKALVEKIIMPTIALVMPGNQAYTKWEWTVGAKKVPYGEFLGEVVNFLIVALVLFIFIVKFLGWLMKSKKKEIEAIPPLTKDQALLTEIRDLLLRDRKSA